jgi:hypothetical protein
LFGLARFSFLLAHPKEFGKLGQKKPDYSWSWFLEVDDSEVMAWANREGVPWRSLAVFVFYCEFS